MLVSYHQPKSFSDNSAVNIGNNWLKRINRKNYHHFFLRAHLKQEGFEDWEINNVANITIVDDFLNKQSIGAQRPSTYMRKFEKTNKELAETMRTHDCTKFYGEFGVWDNDYVSILKNAASSSAKSFGSASSLARLTIAVKLNALMTLMRKRPLHSDMGSRSADGCRVRQIVFSNTNNGGIIGNNG